MHMAKPATMFIIPKTVNGKRVENNDKDPINEAVSKQILAQMVHEKTMARLCLTLTNSDVLDTINVSDTLTIDFSMRLTTNASVAYFGTVSESEM